MTEYTGSGSTRNDEVRRILFDCAMQGKWDEAVKVYEQQPWLRPEKITEGGDTTTAYSCPGSPRMASIGNVSMCECFTKEHNDLVGICNEDGENPLFLAARHGKIQAFICLLDKAWEPDLALATISIVGTKKAKQLFIVPSLEDTSVSITSTHHSLAHACTLYKDLGSSRDEKGVSPLHLLASQPTAFRSGTRLSLFDKIIYHCIFVLPTHFGDAKKSDNPAERQTLVKLLPVPWNNIKGLFFLIVKFIKICINPSGGEKAENARRALDEETPAQAIFEQGPASTLVKVLMSTVKRMKKRLLIQAILLVLGIGRSYINKIQKKKAKHVWSAKILEKLLDKSKGHWYDSTGKDPVYTDRTILYEGENRWKLHGRFCQVRHPKWSQNMRKARKKVRKSD
ncbi:hypothetical protein CK203_002547 [Vitis vinifera]|uniref:Uncharacterized protein n=1 Tax=Vitis vinifera TaxID=29760 RepID=A0A438KIH6_VITVI|nr:hypothetical protein CK203_002547 [Vitis vinifera]